MWLPGKIKFTMEVSQVLKASSKLVDLKNVLVLACERESLSMLGAPRLGSAGHVLIILNEEGT